MHNMFLVNLIDKEGKTIPVGIADSTEDLKKMIEYIKKLFGNGKIEDYQIAIFSKCL